MLWKGLCNKWHSLSIWLTEEMPCIVRLLLMQHTLSGFLWTSVPLLRAGEEQWTKQASSVLGIHKRGGRPTKLHHPIFYGAMCYGRRSLKAWEFREQWKMGVQRDVLCYYTLLKCSCWRMGDVPHTGTTCDCPFIPNLTSISASPKLCPHS